MEKTRRVNKDVIFSILLVCADMCRLKLKVCVSVVRQEGSFVFNVHSEVCTFDRNATSVVEMSAVLI